MKKISTLMACALAAMAAAAQNVTDMSGLTVVGETTFVMQQEPRGDWGSTLYEIPVDGVAELLGVERGELQAGFNGMFYAQTWNSGTETWGELVNDGNVDVAAGFYYQAGGIVDEATQEESAVCINTYDWSACIFFFHKGLYDPERDIVQIGCGQNPGKADRVGRHEVNNYIVNGDKAYVIHIAVNIEAPEQQLTLDDMARVGGDEWIVDMRDARKSWEELDSLELDIDAVLALFAGAMGREVAADELSLMAVNEYGGLTDMYTADNDEWSRGFWFAAETGRTQMYEWGTKSYFINYAAGEQKLYMGNMPNAFAGGEECSTRLYLVAGDSHYFELAFTLTVAAPEFTLETCDMDEMNMVVQLVPSAEAWEVRRVDVTDIEQMLGAADLKLYGVTAEGYLTTDYSVSEAAQGGGGFWMSAADADGVAHAAWYTGDGAFAIWYTGAGEMVFFNMPGLSQPGDKAKATFYVANLFDGKALKINMTVRYVEVIKEIEPVGRESVALDGRDEDGKYFSEVEFDFTACAAALGAEADVLRESAELHVISTDGDLTAMGQNDEGMFTFNADGEQTTAESDDAVFQIGMQDGMLRALIIGDDNLANSYEAVVYVVYGDSVYALDVTVSCGTADGIADVAGTPRRTAACDLSGRTLAAPSRGIVIRDGKKFFVK